MAPFVTIAQINEGASVCLYDEVDARHALDHPRSYPVGVRERAELLLETEPERRAREDACNYPPRHPKRVAAGKFLAGLDRETVS